MLKGTPAVLRNAHTGKAVPAKATWDAQTLTLVVDPVNALHARTPATGSRSGSRSSTAAATTSCRSTGASSPGS